MSSLEFTTLSERFRALRSIAESIISCREPAELFRRLAGELQRVVSFDGLGLLLYDAERGITQPYLLDTADMVLDRRPVADTVAETRWSETIRQIRQRGVASFCLLPLP